MLILHLSDLHFGNKNRFGDDDPADLAVAFFKAICDEDVNEQAGDTAKIDIVVVTGDLVETGLPSQFKTATKFFLALAKEMKLPKPRFVFLPGNHDLSWAACRSVRAQCQNEEIKEEELDDYIQKEKLANYRKFLSDFYGSGVNENNLADLHNVRRLGADSWLRDFPELCLSIAALNTCERENDKIKGGYISSHQSQKLMDAWQEEAFTERIKIIGIHHNPIATTAANTEWTEEWLRCKEKKLGTPFRMPLDDFEHYVADLAGFEGKHHLIKIATDTQPHLIIHGHHHDQGQPQSWPWKKDGSAAVLSVGSFGLKEDQLPDDAPLSCQLLRFDLPPKFNSARLKAIPLIYDGRFRLDGRILKGAFRLERRSNAAYDQPLSLPEGWTKAISTKSPSPKSKGKTAAVISRPDLPLHPIDTFLDTADAFIGRASQLGLAADAVKGLMKRFHTGEERLGSQGFKVIWTHGFGGMGKSWFLHRIRYQAEEQFPGIKSLIVDWDKREWLEPLKSEPRGAEEVFDLLAIRLAQRLGKEIVEPYWQAKDRVAIAAAAHKKAVERFDDQMSKAALEGRDQVDARLTQLLIEERLWQRNDETRKRNMQILRENKTHYREIFAAWCREIGETDPSVICPNRERANGLRQAMRNAMERHPIIVLLDTCEVLSEDIDAWLRELLTPLIREPLPLLVLFGSRLRPDLHQPKGRRRGWQEELPPAALHVDDFGELLRFSISEIELSLEKLEVSIEGDVEALAERLHRVTRGVPLAVRGLLDLHEKGSSVMSNLAIEEEEALPLEEKEADIQRVIGKVADRILLNLEGQPEHEEDLRDIIALAVMPTMDIEFLKAYWSHPSPKERLRALAKRYSLLSDGGDLHPTVRSYLRTHWRDEDKWPAPFREVVQSLARHLSPPVAKPTPANIKQRLNRIISELNLRSWNEGGDIIEEIARAICLTRVYEVDSQPLEMILRELSLSGRDNSKAGKFWQTKESQSPDTPSIVKWLRKMKDTSSRWTDEEKAGLDLLEGSISTNYSMLPKMAAAKIASLIKAIDHFGLDDLPQRDTVGKACFDCARSIDSDSYSNSWREELLDAAVAGYEYAIDLHHLESPAFNNVGNLYKDHLDDPQKAEKAYLTAIEIDPKSAFPHNGLGDLYQYKLDDPQKAEKAYLTAIEIDPKLALPHDGLGDLYQYKLDEPQKAEKTYLEATEIDPKFVYAHIGLGDLYQYKLDEPQKAEKAYLEAAEIDPRLAQLQYGLGNLYQRHLDEPQKAEKAYLEATEIDPKLAYAHIGLGDLYQYKLDEPQKAEKAYLEAIKIDSKLASPHDGLGDLYQSHLDKPQKAEKAYLKAIGIDSKYAQPHYGLGNLYQRHLDEPQKAEKAYLKAVEIDPKFAQPYNGLGNLYIDYLDEPQKAEKAYLKAVEIDPKLAQPHNGLGILYQYKLDEPQKAEKAYLKAIEIDRKYAQPHSGLGHLYMDCEQWEKARLLLEKADALENGNSASGKRGLAWLALISETDFKEAKRLFDQANSIDSKHPGAALIQVAIDIWSKEWKDAKYSFEKWVSEMSEKDSFVISIANRKFVRLIEQISHKNGLDEVTEIFHSVADKPWWMPWSIALDTLLSRENSSSLSDPKAIEIHSLLATRINL